jgi:hypothetical protein
MIALNILGQKENVEGKPLFDLMPDLKEMELL